LSRQKLIKQLKKRNSQLNQSEIETVLDLLSKNIVTILKRGSSIEIRDFGRFFCKKIKENFNARNPNTNELIYKPERVKVRFKASKKLNKIINE
tara:strand:+ start:2457 stop:2738 length:282 start_codon:yes stop_codon:yes gene_type:complete